MTDCRRDDLGGCAVHDSIWPEGPRCRVAQGNPSGSYDYGDTRAEVMAVGALYRAMCSVDNDDPGAFNIVAISEPDTRPLAAAILAAMPGYRLVPVEEWERLTRIKSAAEDLEDVAERVRGLPKFALVDAPGLDFVLAEDVLALLSKEEGS